ncbi:SDR family oxidoreductase [Daejeonella oryzae]|uniref:SDR family oxidoreductase n=1 Tax=Daejeonella oryzae TaxID=1122943 RepID=UPI000421C9A7|nr:SDR family oxidoreductase [Daejeonella oryzae]
MSKVILITGTSSGVGLHTAVHLAAQGNKVYASMRDLSKKEDLENLAGLKNVSLEILQLDIQKNEEVEAAVNTIISKENRIDVLINNAGAGFIGTMEQTSMEEIHNTMDINFYGPIRCMKAVLPFMRKQHAGHIINISSVGGLVGQPMNEIYCAAKFALEGLSESIATYMEPYFGINVSIIEPGGIITEFGNNIFKNLEKSGGIKKGAYEPLVNDYMDYRASFTDEMKAKAFQTPDQIAELISSCIADKKPALRYLSSENAEKFTYLKSGLDTSGNHLQAMIRKNILNK